MNSITLYRPVGQKELDLVAQSAYRAFPPRLPEQPIFYPVLNREYAEQIARDWNIGLTNSIATFGDRFGWLGHLDLKSKAIHRTAHRNAVKDR